jgi:hypothetical protein
MADPSRRQVTRRSFWVRFCQWLWRGLSFLWVAIVIAVFSNVVSSRLISDKDFPPDSPAGWILHHLTITAALGIVLLLLTIFVRVIGYRDASHTSHAGLLLPTPSQQSRHALLRYLRQEYTRQLAHSLQGASMIALGLHERTDITRSSAQLIFRRTEATEVHEHSLSPGTSIVQAYDDAGHGLLILGEPGAGKTTLVLDLAHELLTRAESDPTHPIPVILNLSSFALKNQPLAAWLIDQLQLVYSVPPRLSQTWIQEDQLLLLLDGLDEVVPSAYSACIRAINAYRVEHFVPLVVCSRSREYLSQQEHLALPSAVVVQPLTDSQVEAYLIQAGKPMAAVRKVLQTNLVLHELMTTPLMLSVVTLAYRGKAVKDLPRLGSAEEQQRQIFASYIKRMLEQGGTEHRYSPQHSMHWLTWLARQMKQRSQSIFYLEQMQPDWLEAFRLNRAYALLAVRLPGILIGILVSLVINILLFGYVGTVSLIQYGLMGGLLGGLLSVQKPILQPAIQKMRVWKRLARSLILVLSPGVIIGLGFWLSDGLLIGPNFGWNDWLQDGITYGVVFGLNSIWLSMLLYKRSIEREKKLQKEVTIRSQKNPWSRFINTEHLINGLFVGLGILLSFELSFGLYIALNDGLLTGLYVGLPIALDFCIIGAILSIILVGKKRTIQPTEIIVWSRSGLRRSLTNVRHLRNTLFVALISGLFIGISVGLRYGQIYELSVGLRYGLSFGLFAMLGAGLLYWFLLGLIQGVSSEVFDEHQRVVPNQGILRSARNSLVLGFVSGCIGGLVGILEGIVNYVVGSGLGYGLRYGPGAGLSYELRYGLSAVGFGLRHGLYLGLLVGVAGGFLVGLLNGGLAWFQHYVLRFLLWRRGSIPWDYPRFLNEAAKRILLRKVGGGYSFIHPLFLDYFASLAEVAPPSSVQQPSP